MIETLTYSVISGVFFAGVVTAFLPCTYPMLLGYIGLLTGWKQKTFAVVIKKTLLFFVGFAITYAFFGSVAGLFGTFSSTTLFFNTFKGYIASATGVLLILFGLILLRALPLPSVLRSFKHIPIPTWFHIDAPFAPVILGVVFAAGWSPCIGPVLGGVLLLAGISSSVVSGILLLIVFSIGLAIPFIGFALMYVYAKDRLPQLARYAQISQVIAGIILIALGLLFLFGNIGILGTYVPSIFEAYI